MKSFKQSIEGGLCVLHICECLALSPTLEECVIRFVAALFSDPDWCRRPSEKNMSIENVDHERAQNTHTHAEILMRGALGAYVSVCAINQRASSKRVMEDMFREKKIRNIGHQ